MANSNGSTTPDCVVDVELRVHGVFVRGHCAICGGVYHDKGCGVDPFVVATWDRVCEPCADARRPGLTRAGQAIAFLWDQNTAHMALLDQLADVLNTIAQPHLDMFVSELRDRDELHRAWKRKVAAAPAEPDYSGIQGISF
jgi:hypothetical protein